MKIKSVSLPQILLLITVFLWAGLSHANFLQNLGAFWRGPFGALSIAPTTVTMKPGRLWQLTASGGQTPYTFSVASGGGSVNATTGVYTAPTTGGGTAVVRVTDGGSSTADATISISSITPTNCADQTIYDAAGTFYDPQGTSDYIVNIECQMIFLNPQGNDITVSFSAFNTEADYDFVKFYNSASTLLTSYSGTSLPPNQSRTDGYLRMNFNSDPFVVGTGFVGTWSFAQSGVPLIMPDKTNMDANETISVAVLDGVGPYSFYIYSGAGTLTAVDAYSVTFTSPFATGATVIRVTDTLNQTSSVTVNYAIGAIAVTGVTPNNGPKAGGTSVVVNGSGFVPGATVTFNGVACTSPTVLTSGTISCTTPAGSGLTDVKVTNPDTGNATGVGIFTYAWGAWSAMAGPGAGLGRVGNARVWTGNKLLVWGGQDQTCNYVYCLKSDGYVYDAISDSWSAMSVSPLAARLLMSYAWTGSSMLIFSGRNSPNGGSMDCVSSDGAKYDPYADTWTSIAVPTWTRRQNPSFVWTGKELLVWGGQGDYTVYNHGNAYNPDSNTWRNIASSPKARWYHSAHWTGRKMIVWGGISSGGTSYYNDGDVYDPASNTWSTMAASSALATYDLEYWLGSMGEKFYTNSGYQSSPGTDKGGIYNAETDSWTSDDHYFEPGAAIIWTGKHILTYSQTAVKLLDPDTGVWISSSVSSTKNNHYGSVAWTGKYLLACFGTDQLGIAGGGVGYDTCEKFDMTDLANRLSAMGNDSWISSSTTNAPSARQGHTTLWTGKNMLVWGGYDGTDRVNTGAKYDPVSDSWSAITTTGAPSARTAHSAIWIGNRMIVWGGETAASTVTNTGGVYNPYADSWTATSTGANVASARKLNTVVWTGSKVVVWGGSNGSDTTIGDGAMYDPTANTWSTVSAVSPPSPRVEHKAIWTGSKMIVWGGYSSGTYFNDGGLYDPVGNTWSATSTGTDVPSARRGFNIALSGTKMLIWGGETAASTYTNTGGVYDIPGNTWTVTSVGANVPSARTKASGVWSGRHLIVWGGYDGAAIGNGAIYDYRSNSWTSLTTAGGIAARYDHGAIWTGQVGDGQSLGSNPFGLERFGDLGRMILWGGFDGTSYHADGFIYNLPNM